MMCIELPCKAGDTVYCVIESDVVKGIVNSIEIDDCGMSIYCDIEGYGCLTYLPQDFGDDIFLNYAEAEIAANGLKE